MTEVPTDPTSEFDLAPDLDLTPRAAEPVKSTGRKWMPRLILAGLAVAFVAVLFQTLGDASLFFLNVDEAIERRDELGEQRFTIQGTPVDRAVELNVDGQQAVAFTLQFEGTTADVIHIGSLAETFQPSVPVVLEGHWTAGAPSGADFSTGANDGYHFESTRMLVKHDNDYRVDNEARLDEAERGGMIDSVSP